MQINTLEAKTPFVLTVGLDRTDTESSGFAFAQAVRGAAGIIVVGSHEIPHLKAIFMGSMAERLMSASRCPVLIGGPRPNRRPSYVIAIGPPCADCVDRRAASGGVAWWCARHAGHDPVMHNHSHSLDRDCFAGGID